MPLSSQHRPAVQKILAGEVWEPSTIDFLTSNCKDGDIVHAGTLLAIFCRRCHGLALWEPRYGLSNPIRRLTDVP